MKEKCVYWNEDLRNPNLPMFRGPHGACLARPGKEMRNCCFNATCRFLDLKPRVEVLIVLEDLKGQGEGESVASKVRGIGAALDNRR
jgi:hypothetical protein